MKNQNGSRILQKALKNTDKNIISQMYSELKGNISNLLIDPYANYFIQKFFNFINENERIEFLKELKMSIIDVGNSKIGTYPLQSILEQLCTTTEREIIVNYICDAALMLCQVIIIFNLTIKFYLGCPRCTCSGKDINYLSRVINRKII